MQKAAFSRLEVIGILAGALTFIVIISGCATAPPPADPAPGQPVPGQPVDVDTDGDEIPDADDLCADTPAGRTVDATGCPVVVAPPAPTDSDGDGVNDEDDDCADTPSDVNVDASGCPVSVPGTPDTDGDGVNDDIDQCANTPADTTVEANGCPDADDDGISDDNDDCSDTEADLTVDNAGCAENQLDSDRDGVFDDADDCPGTTPGARVDAVGCEITVGPPGPGPTPPECGNGTIEEGEECEPPNTDVCSDTCTVIAGGSFDADACEDAGSISGEGAFEFDNTIATQDGPPHRDCVLEGEDNIDADVWACWTAPCSSTAFVRTCGLTTIDTKIAVYKGCDCSALTDENLLSCNDDRCGFQSIATFEAEAQQQYLIRVGVFPGDTSEETGPGTGAINITCGLEACTANSGPCTEESDSVGCDDVGCCETVCALDSYCCETEWDDVCVDEAAGLCSGSFPTCGRGAGVCTEENGSPGCDDTDCCNAVCMEDPYCCLNTWDDTCANEEAMFCSSSCGDGAGDCFALDGNGSAGCESPDCCAEVCLRDSYCCRSEWDGSCADLAAEFCNP